MENVVSESVDVLSGVPQGSILGPLLFVLFINDIYANIYKDTNIALYADDTKIWRDINSEADCEILQKDINSLCGRETTKCPSTLISVKLCLYMSKGLI